MAGTGKGQRGIVAWNFHAHLDGDQSKRDKRWYIEPCAPFQHPGVSEAGNRHGGGRNARAGAKKNKGLVLETWTRIQRVGTPAA